jgi:hypothetical protein
MKQRPNRPFNNPFKKEDKVMANCAEMAEGDLFLCDICGLELQVVKTCDCSAGGEVFCSVPLQCCGKDMIKKLKK